MKGRKNNNKIFYNYKYYYYYFQLNKKPKHEID